MDLAKDPCFRERVQNWLKDLDNKLNYHTLELPDGTAVPGVIPVEALRSRLAQLGVPLNLTGLSLLDVGAASGWNSFEAERRGASVVALDCVPYPELVAYKEKTGSAVKYIIEDIDHISPDYIGRFDVVLFLGVLYHVRHPLLALERICSVSRSIAFIESYVTDSQADLSPLESLQFYETDELGGQIDNWYGPSTKCLLALCRAAGFVRVKLQYSHGGRAGVLAHRQWLAAPDDQNTFPEPQLRSAVNNRSGNKQFHSFRDEYICIYFRCSYLLSRDTLQIQVGPFGVAPLIVIQTGHEEWQANCYLPPGLPSGKHDVTIRHQNSRRSRPVSIEIVNQLSELTTSQAGQRIDPTSESTFLLNFYRVLNSYDSSCIFTGRRSERVSLFVHAHAQLVDGDVEVHCDAERLDDVVVLDLGDGHWQVNARLPKRLAPGAHEIRVKTSKSPLSDHRLIEFIPDGLQL
jgi:tRNA (mo5U34)-methyltransferase